MKQWLFIIGSFILGGLTVFFWFVPPPFAPKTFEVPTIGTPTTILGITIEGSESLVKRVIDGDTIELISGAKVRYIGIDTPETVDPRRPVACFGREASEENKRLVLGKTVRLEKDVSEIDRFGRLLRYVYVGEIMVNDYLVRQGFALPVTYPPDVKYQDQFREAEVEARGNSRGLWVGCPLNNTTNTTNFTNKTIEQNDTQSDIPSVENQNFLNSECVIKGNISTSGEKIYHITGCGSYYKTVIDESTGERWFCTEGEAQKAGWRKARNC